MIAAHGVQAVRAAEAAVMAGLPDGVLMQRAAAALAAAVSRELVGGRGRVYGARVVLLVGPGSNGGDALWAGARLARRGARVDALLVTEQVHAEGLAALRAAGGEAVDFAAVGFEAVGFEAVDLATGEHYSNAASSLGHTAPIGSSQGAPAPYRAALAGADVVVDGVLGIGGRPGIDEALAGVRALLRPGVPVVAVDLPSGVDPDTGECPGPVLRADLTVTFGTAKPCLLLPPASAAAGRLEVVDIGLGPALASSEPVVERLTGADLARLWPVPGADDDKYRRGVVGVVAGGRTYTGAAVLATGAAVRAGAGMVRYVGPPEPTDLVRSRWPEVVPGEGRVQAWVLGPGADPDADDGQSDAIREALRSGLPCLVDAGALDLLPPEPAPATGPLLLTPHAGELARLLSRLQGRLRGGGAGGVQRSDVQAAPLRHARLAAELTGATVLLKGATTLVVSPDGRVRSQADGPHWLATAGAGDVLAGLAGTLLAAGLDPLDAGSVAAAVHGRAGTRASAGGPVSAEDVLSALPATVADLLTSYGY